MIYGIYRCGMGKAAVCRFTCKTTFSHRNALIYKMTDAVSGLFTFWKCYFFLCLLAILPGFVDVRNSSR